ncbi:MAG: hypothetical protein QXU98_13065 [Candidatus Parvarchaeota archaeon]
MTKTTSKVAKGRLKPKIRIRLTAKTKMASMVDIIFISGLSRLDIKVKYILEGIDI